VVKINVYRFESGKKFEMKKTNKNVKAKRSANATRKYAMRRANDFRGAINCCSHLLK
jgi:hypothetical protein